MNDAVVEEGSSARVPAKVAWIGTVPAGSFGVTEHCPTSLPLVVAVQAAWLSNCRLIVWFAIGVPLLASVRRAAGVDLCCR